MPTVTLGLAFCGAGRIYVASESFGLPDTGSYGSRMVSKILYLQPRPAVVVLAAGGLDHWCHVLARYEKQPTVDDAASRLVALLDECMTENNQAYGRVVGFSAGRPVCFKIDREPNAQSAKREAFLEFGGGQVAFVGLTEDGLAIRTAEAAKAKIERNIPPLSALVEAIRERMPHPRLKWPIHARVIEQGD